jgi:hypothetical protein
MAKHQCDLFNKNYFLFEALESMEEDAFHAGIEVLIEVDHNRERDFGPEAQAKPHLLNIGYLLNYYILINFIIINLITGPSKSGNNTSLCERQVILIYKKSTSHTRALVLGWQAD